MFDKTHQSLGQVKAGVEQTIKYNLIGDGSITAASASCGCSVPKFSAKELTVKFTPQPLIPGIIERTDKKNVVVTVSGKAGQQQVTLSFDATVQ